MFNIDEFAIDVKEYKKRIFDFCTESSKSVFYQSFKDDKFYVKALVLFVGEIKKGYSYTMKAVRLKDLITDDEVTLEVKNQKIYEELRDKINQVLIFNISIRLNNSISKEQDSVQLYYNFIINNYVGSSQQLQNNTSLFDLSDLDILKNSLRKNNDFPLEYNIAVIHSFQTDDNTSQTYLDFYHQIEGIKDKIKTYDSYPCSISNPESVLSTLNNIDFNKYNILVIIRGGTLSKEDTTIFDVFNNKEIIKKITSFEGYIICGLGHSKHLSLLDLLANYSADTPTAAGVFLHDKIYGRFMDEETIVNAEKLKQEQIENEINKRVFNELKVYDEQKLQPLRDEIIKLKQEKKEFDKTKEKYPDFLRILEENQNIIKNKDEIISSLRNEIEKYQKQNNEVSEISSLSKYNKPIILILLVIIFSLLTLLFIKF